VWERVYQIQRRDAINVWDFCGSEGGPGFVVLWDHWQPYLEKLVEGYDTEYQDELDGVNLQPYRLRTNRVGTNSGQSS
jgi:hypothetical protein